MLKKYHMIHVADELSNTEKRCIKTLSFSIPCILHYQILKWTIENHQKIYQDSDKKWSGSKEKGRKTSTLMRGVAIENCYNSSYLTEM